MLFISQSLFLGTDTIFTVLLLAQHLHPAHPILLAKAQKQNTSLFGFYSPLITSIARVYQPPQCFNEPPSTILIAWLPFQTFSIIHQTSRGKMLPALSGTQSNRWGGGQLDLCEASTSALSDRNGSYNDELAQSEKQTCLEIMILFYFALS